MKLGRIYNENGTIVWNPNEKPDKRDFIYLGVEGPNISSQYLKALKKWSNNNVVVENACQYDEPDGIVINPDSPKYEVGIIGQEAILSGKTITKFI